MILVVWLLATDRVSPALAVLGASVTLMVLGITTPQQAFAGFSNPAPITVAALYIVARAVEKTGALQPLVSGVLDGGGRGRRSLLRILAPTAGASAFLNNTPIVAMLAPQVADWADRRGQPAAWFLMPISFAAILGGTITVIGTSTNLVVSGLLEAAGERPIGMFEVSPVGLPLALIGIGAVVILAPLLLRDRRGVRQQLEQDLREFVVDMVVEPGGPLHGRTVERAGLRNLKGVFLAHIQREGETIAPAGPETVLRGEDRLAFVGRANQIVDLQAIRGLRSAEHRHVADFGKASEHTFFEAVVSGTSPLAGKTLKSTGFRGRYQAAVLAIHRSGDRVHAKLGDVVLHAGDTLVLLADHGFRDRWRDRSDFLLVSKLGGAPPVSTRKAWLVAAITAGIVVVAGAGFVPILQAAVTGAMALVLLRVLSPAEARAAVDLDVIIVIAAAFGIGAAIETSGLASLVAGSLISVFEGFGPYGLLFGVLVATVISTEIITNNAAAVLVFPIAAATAAAAGLDVRPFAVAVMFGASASFLTPIGYQTNTMVYGPGGYRFGDYARLGLPLTIIMIGTVLLLVPRVWSF
ncbi:MAG TPA: SLC13 family permease [Longimicrobiales bacterium]|nr:SLC13 family permease [Longimicrobiales bacterium]